MRPSLPDILRDHPADVSLIEMSVDVTTAEAAAEARQVPVSSIAKTLLLRCEPLGYVAVVLRGTDQLDQTRVRAHLGARRVHFASRDAVLRVTGYPAGGTPPIGLGAAIPVLVDEAVLELKTVLAGGGSPELLIELSPQRLVELSAATVGIFRKGAHPNP